MLECGQHPQSWRTAGAHSGCPPCHFDVIENWPVTMTPGREDPYLVCNTSSGAPGLASKLYLPAQHPGSRHLFSPLAELELEHSISILKLGLWFGTSPASVYRLANSGRHPHSIYHRILPSVSFRALYIWQRWWNLVFMHWVCLTPQQKQY